MPKGPVEHNRNLSITIIDGRTADDRGGKPRRRKRTYEDHRQFLGDFKHFSQMKDVVIQEETHSVVTILPADRANPGHGEQGELVDHGHEDPG